MKCRVNSLLFPDTETAADTYTHTHTHTHKGKHNRLLIDVPRRLIHSSRAAVDFSYLLHPALKKFTARMFGSVLAA